MVQNACVIRCMSGALVDDHATDRWFSRFEYGIEYLWHEDKAFTSLHVVNSLLNTRLPRYTCLKIKAP